MCNSLKTQTGSQRDADTDAMSLFFLHNILEDSYQQKKNLRSKVN